MTNIVVGIVFGGASPEHNESIRAAQILYRYAINDKLDRKYKFRYFYLSRHNQWASIKHSAKLIRELPTDDPDYDLSRIADLEKVDVIYSTCMGPCGENGNIAGLADLLEVPVIGCDILASAITLDKRLSKILAQSINIPVVDYLCVDRSTSANSILPKIRFPCFVKPTNMGTCAYVFKARNEEEFTSKWRSTTQRNEQSNKYLIEPFIPNIEIRVFVHQDLDGKLHTNDQYVTTLKEAALNSGGTLFDHMDNPLSKSIRKTICDYATRIFKLFGMKDYARIDFFVEQGTDQIYFNEANTQPFIGSFNIKLMEKDGYSYAQFLDWMIQRNHRR